jgi:hypothetical protein
VSEVVQIELIKLLDIRLHTIITLPHYEDGTNGGMSAGLNKKHQEHMKEMMERQISSLKTNED